MGKGTTSNIPSFLDSSPQQLTWKGTR